MDPDALPVVDGLEPSDLGLDEPPAALAERVDGRLDAGRDVLAIEQDVQRCGCERRAEHAGRAEVCVHPEDGTAFAAREDALA